MAYIFLILFIMALVSLDHPDTMFWIFLTLLFDPGGLIYFYLVPLLRDTVKGVDVLLVLSFVPLFSAKVNVSTFFRDRIARSFIWFFLLFYTYYIFIYGLFQPDTDLNEFVSAFLIKRRIDILGFLLIIPIYVFAKRSLQKFITITAVVSVIFLTIYFISVITGFKIIPYVEFSRYTGTDVMRKSMFSLGTAEFLIPIAVGYFLINRSWKMRNWVVTGAILCIITILISLSKNSIFNVGIVFLAMIYFISKLNLHFRTQSVIRYLTFIFIIVSALAIIFPSYLDYSLQAVGDIFRMFTGQKTLSGEDVTSRFDVQVPIQTAIFLKNPFFGTGYSDLWYTMEGFRMGLGSNDIPVVSSFAMFGIIGSFFYLILYIKIFNLAIKAYRLVKRYNLFSHMNELAIDLLMLLSSIAFFITKGLNVFLWFSDLVTYSFKFPMLLNLGILLATYSRLSSYIENVKKQNAPVGDQKIPSWNI